MDAAEVLTELTAAGVTLTRHGDRLRLAPPQAVPAPLVEELRRNKADLLRLVGPEAPVAPKFGQVCTENGPRFGEGLVCYACKGSDFWQGEPIHYADGTAEPGSWVCRRCHPQAPGAEQESSKKVASEYPERSK